jgi:hypothetical protein
MFWVQVIFKTFAKQLHDEYKLCVFDNQESLKTVNSVHTNISGDNSKIFATCVHQKEQAMPIQALSFYMYKAYIQYI